MTEEFKRFGLNTPQRKITGILQVLGGLGLLLGIDYPLIGLIAAGGLSLLMLLGFVVRLKIRDSIRQTLPSFIFIVLNGYLFWQFLHQMN